MEKTPCRYQLKPGALLQAFGDSSKICTNKNITDELAEWHLKNNPGCINLFAKVPEKPWEAPADTKIVKTKETVTDPAALEALKLAEKEAIETASHIANTGTAPVAKIAPVKTETKTANKQKVASKPKK